MPLKVLETNSTPCTEARSGLLQSHRSGLCDTFPTIPTAFSLQPVAAEHNRRRHRAASAESQDSPSLNRVSSQRSAGDPASTLPTRFDLALLQHGGSAYMTKNDTVSPFSCDPADLDLDDEVIQQGACPEVIVQDTIERRLESMVSDMLVSD